MPILNVYCFCFLSPIEIFSAVDFSLFVEALLVEQFPTALAFDTRAVPRLVQEVEQEPVQDGPGAPGTLHGHHPNLSLIHI